LHNTVLAVSRLTKMHLNLKYFYQATYGSPCIITEMHKTVILLNKFASYLGMNHIWRWLSLGCSLAVVYQRFRGACRLHHQSELLIPAAVRISELTKAYSTSNIITCLYPPLTIPRNTSQCTFSIEITVCFLQNMNQACQLLHYEMNTRQGRDAYRSAHMGRRPPHRHPLMKEKSSLRKVKALAFYNEL
jgi:hypothetical protein